jgi:hypothetical protein
MSTIGDLIVAEASRHAGLTEVPYASNRNSDRIDDWQIASAKRRNKPDGTYLGAPWCAIFVDHVYRQVGVDLPPFATDPYTGYICDEGRARGWVRDHRKTWPPGSMMISCGKHVGIVEHDEGNGYVQTVEGNFNHSVTHGRRRKSDWIAIVPPQILRPAPPTVTTRRVLVYWAEDLNLMPDTHGPFRSARVQRGKIKQHRRRHGVPADRIRPFVTSSGPRGRKQFWFQVFDSDDSLQFKVTRPDGKPWRKKRDRDRYVRAYRRRTGHQVALRQRFTTERVKVPREQLKRARVRTTGGTTT